MKTEEINYLWEDYNTKLEKSLRFNEQLLKKVNLNNVKKELSTPIFSEVFTIICTAIFVIYLATVSTLLADEIRFSIPGFLAAGSSIILILFAIARIRSFRKLDYIKHSIVELQKELQTLQYRRYRFGRLELFFGLCAATLMWPLILYAGFQIDVYQQFSVWAMALILVAIIAIPFTIIHEKYYRKKLHNAHTLMKEIEEFEKGNGRIIVEGS